MQKKIIIGLIVFVIILTAGLAAALIIGDREDNSKPGDRTEDEVSISKQDIKKEGKKEGEAAPVLEHQVRDACNILDDKNAKSVLGDSAVRKGLRVTFEGRVHVTQCSYESEAYKATLTLRRYVNSDDAKKQLNTSKIKTPQSAVKSEYILSAAVTNSAGTTANTEKAQALLDDAMKGL